MARCQSLRLVFVGKIMPHLHPMPDNISYLIGSKVGMLYIQDTYELTTPLPSTEASPTEESLAGATMNVTLSNSEIRPKIGRTSFKANLIQRTPNDNVQQNHIQPMIPGGSTTITVEITGAENLAGISITLTFEPVLRTGGHDHYQALTDEAKKAFGGLRLPEEKNSQLRTEIVNGKIDAKGIFKAVFQARNLADAKYSSAAGDVQIVATAKLPGEVWNSAPSEIEPSPPSPPTTEPPASTTPTPQPTPIQPTPTTEPPEPTCPEGQVLEDGECVEPPGDGGGTNEPGDDVLVED